MSARSAKAAHVLEFEHPIIELDAKIEELENFSEITAMDLSGQIAQMRIRSQELKREIFASLTPWERIQVARHPGRPVFDDYFQALFTDTLELHGDMTSGDDGAIYTGFATLGDVKMLIVGHRKGKTTKDRVAYNYAMAHPEGYRKALAKMKLAEKFNLPIVTFIDTPGAYPGLDAEKRGQAFAIARNLLEMARVKVPIVCVVIGEGGSGGALGIGVGDRMLMLEHAYYSVISPEGCATILWKSVDFADQAARILRLTAQDLKNFGIADEIIPEPPGGAHSDSPTAIGAVRAAILDNLAELRRLSYQELLAHRYAKHRAMGAFLESAEAAPEPSRNGAPGPRPPEAEGA